MNNCGNITKPKTRVYNYIAKLGLFKDLPETISDDTVFWPRNFDLNLKMRHFYTTPEGNLVFEKPKGPPLSWETYINRELIESVYTIYGMALPKDTKIVNFVIGKQNELSGVTRSYIEFNQEILDRIEKYAYEYPQELVPPQIEESDKLEPDDFTAKESPSPSITPAEKVEKVESSFPEIDKNKQLKLFQVKTIFNSVEQLNTQLKSINKTVAAIGSDKNIDEVLKKAGLTPELRSQFIQLVKENPELKSLKVGDVVSFYLKQFEKNTNDQYYKAILEPINKGLEDTLIKYFDRFNISRVELENLKEKFGVDSTGVYDVLNKIIYYANNRNLLTLPEEYGHVFVELLGAVPSKKAQNPLFQYLYENVESWDGYQRVFEDYKNLYVNEFGKPDIYRIKKEAIGQAIGLALVRNYQGTDKTKSFWTAIKEAIDYVLNLIKGVDYVSLNTAADSIARDILSNNYKKLDRLLKDTSNYNLLSYSETIKLQNQKDKGKALEFMKWFSNNGMIITGSLSYRLQGETFRPEIDALHDIDNVVPSDVHGLPMAKDLLFEKIKQALDPTATGVTLRINAERLAESVPVLMEFKTQYPDTEFLYAFSSTKLDNYYITINAIWSENKELKERFKSYSGSFNDRLANFTEEELNQIYLFDFFLSARPSSDYITIAERDYGLTLNHFSESFYEKQTAMGRPKDAFDYQKWKAFEGTIPAPVDFKSRLTYFQVVPSSSIKPGVAELFESKRSFADYSDFGKTLSEQEIINLKKEGNKVTAKQFLESIAPVNDFEKKLKSFLLSIDLNKLNNFDFVINDKYQGNIIGLNERELFEKPTVIFNSKTTNQPSRYKLHEFLHSLLDTVINEEQEFRTELISLYDYVKTLPEFKNEYGVIGWWEFYTEGMTNPDFQAKLKNVTLSGYKGGKKSSVYEEFVKIINSLLEKLGFINKDYSALDEIINATTKVIEKKYGYGIKPGVPELFESKPILASIGTPEQYSKWINYVTTEGKLAGTQATEILYHGSDKEFDTFDKTKRGIATGEGYFKDEEQTPIDSLNAFFFSTDPAVSEQYGLLRRITQIRNIASVLEYGLTNPARFKELRKYSPEFADHLKQKKEELTREELLSYIKDLYLRYRKVDDELGTGFLNQYNNYTRLGKQIKDLQNKKTDILSGKYVHNSFTKQFPNLGISLYEDKKGLGTYIRDNGEIKHGKFNNRNITELTESEFNELLDIATKSYEEGLSEINSKLTKARITPILYTVLLNVQRPLVKDFEGKSFVNQAYSEGAQYEASKLTNQAAKSQGQYDSVIFKNILDPYLSDNYGVFEPEQVYMLGGEEDIEGFKEFVREAPQKEAPPFYEMSPEEREQRFQDFYSKNQNINEDEAREYFDRCML